MSAQPKDVVSSISLRPRCIENSRKQDYVVVKWDIVCTTQCQAISYLAMEVMSFHTKQFAKSHEKYQTSIRCHE